MPFAMIASRKLISVLLFLLAKRSQNKQKKKSLPFKYTKVALDETVKETQNTKPIVLKIEDEI